MPASYNYTTSMVVDVEVDPIATFISSLKYTRGSRIQAALDHVTSNASVNTDDLAGFFLVGRRAQDAVYGLEKSVATRRGPVSGKRFLTKRAKRRVARALAAELVMKQSRGTLASASSRAAAESVFA